MTFSGAATKRTFYIERRGDSYEIVKVWDVGHTITQADMAFAFTRVMETDPDERIVAEQSLSIASTPGGVLLSAADRQTADQALRATDRILRGDRPKPSPEDRA